MALRKRAFGLSFGLVWGLGIMLSTWWLLIQGSRGEILSKLDTIYLGYSYSWGGSFIGFIWGFVDGFIAGVLIAWFYDVFSKMIYKTQE